jgi:hypothetical protein
MATVSGFDWSAFNQSLRKQRAARKGKAKKKPGGSKGKKKRPPGGGSL